MLRNPMLDMFTGAVIAMGGPMAMMLPQRIFFEMLSGGAMLQGPQGPVGDASTPSGGGRTAV
jgi:hypothetical protein